MKANVWIRPGILLLILGIFVLSAWTMAATFAGFAGNGGSGEPNVQPPSYPYTIKAPAPESTDLAPLAKIGPDQTISAARSAYPGAQSDNDDDDD